jgi:hypothetical protein
MLKYEIREKNINLEKKQRKIKRKKTIKLTVFCDVVHNKSIIFFNLYYN